MFSRIRNSLGLAVLLALLTSITVFAKGGFSFITVAGADLEEPVRITDLALTENFFAFAIFYKDETEAPADPGTGYEIKRFYLEGKREIAFDQLHYYPETGFVFYDGLVNGWSEYDDKWYKANPEIESVFKTALVPSQTQPSLSIPAQHQTVKAIAQTGAHIPQTRPLMSVIVVAGLALVLVFAYWFRKPVTR